MTVHDDGRLTAEETELARREIRNALGPSPGSEFPTAPVQNLGIRPLIPNDFVFAAGLNNEAKEVLRINADGKLIFADATEAAKALKREWERLVRREPVMGEVIIENLVNALWPFVEEWADVPEVTPCSSTGKALTVIKEARAFLAATPIAPVLPPDAQGLLDAAAGAPNVTVSVVAPVQDEPCPTCGALKPSDNEYCSDGFHAPGETYWPVQDVDAEWLRWLSKTYGDLIVPEGHERLERIASRLSPSTEEEVLRAERELKLLRDIEALVVQRHGLLELLTFVRNELYLNYANQTSSVWRRIDAALAGKSGEGDVE